MTTFISLQHITDTHNIRFDDTHTLYEKDIVDIFNGNITETDDSLLNNVIGLYYRHIKKDDDTAIKHYMMASDKDNIIAMLNLVTKYNEMKNYDLMKHYALKILDNHCDDEFSAHHSIYNNTVYTLAKYYYDVKNDPKEGIKYIRMGIEKNDFDSLNYIITKTGKKSLDHTTQDCVVKYFEDNTIEKLDSLKQHMHEFDWYYLCDQLDLSCPWEKDIIIFINKMNMYKEIGNCSFCYKPDKTLIPLHCFDHHYCTDCYKELYNKECYVCRF
jgi:hypothetical protein